MAYIQNMDKATVTLAIWSMVYLFEALSLAFWPNFVFSSKKWEKAGMLSHELMLK